MWEGGEGKRGWKTSYGKKKKKEREQKTCAKALSPLIKTSLINASILRSALF